MNHLVGGGQRRLRDCEAEGFGVLEVDDKLDELAIFSDGIENLVLHKASRSVQQSFFQSMIQPVRKTEATGLDQELSKGLRRYLASSAICERTDDDKTLVLATRRPLRCEKR